MWLALDVHVDCVVEYAAPENLRYDGDDVDDGGRRRRGRRTRRRGL